MKIMQVSGIALSAVLVAFFVFLLTMDIPVEQKEVTITIPAEKMAAANG